MLGNVIKCKFCNNLLTVEPGHVFITNLHCLLCKSNLPKNFQEIYSKHVVNDSWEQLIVPEISMLFVTHFAVYSTTVIYKYDVDGEYYGNKYFLLTELPQQNIDPKDPDLVKKVNFWRTFN